MTRDDIIRMAREAGFRAGSILLSGGDPLPFVGPVSSTDCLPELERFATLVAAAEREACAKAAERCLFGPAARNMAATIRERGNT
jgi:hypothetical protein